MSLTNNLNNKIPCLGILLILCSSFFATGGKFSIKKLPYLHTFVIVLIRCGLLSLVWLFVIAVRRDFIFGKDKNELKLLMLRGLFGFGSFMTSYLALSYIPLADATTIILSSPIYTTIFGYFLLKEKCGPINILLITLTLFGVVMIARPSFIFKLDEDSENETNKIIGTLIAFTSSVIGALNNIVIRKLKETPAPVVVFWFASFSFVFSTLGIIIAKSTFDEEATLTIRTINLEYEFIVLIINTICGIFAQLLITLALKFEEAGTISLARSVDILLSFVFQILFLKNEPIYWTSVVGSIIIATGVTLSALNKIREKKNLVNSKNSKEEKKKTKIIYSNQIDLNDQNTSTNNLKIEIR